jgi:hypothetical protein
MIVFLSQSLAESLAEEVHCLGVSFKFADKVARIRWAVPKVTPVLAVTGLLEEVREDDEDELLKGAAISSIPLQERVFLERTQLSL